jgi:hypothetical protein
MVRVRTAFILALLMLSVPACGGSRSVAPSVAASVTVNRTPTEVTLAPGFAGFSYEKSRLTVPLFAPGTPPWSHCSGASATASCVSAATAWTRRPGTPLARDSPPGPSPHRTSTGSPASCARWDGRPSKGNPYYLCAPSRSCACRRSRCCSRGDSSPGREVVGAQEDSHVDAELRDSDSRCELFDFAPWSPLGSPAELAGERVFGFRFVRGQRVRQSWCHECRRRILPATRSRRSP